MKRKRIPVRSLSELFFENPPARHRDGCFESLTECFRGRRSNRVAPARTFGEVTRILAFLPIVDLFRVSPTCRVFNSVKKLAIQRPFSPDELYILNRLFRMRRLPHRVVHLIEDFALALRIVRVRYRKRKSSSSGNWKSTFLYVNKNSTVGDLKVLAGFIVDRTPCFGQLCSLYWQRRKIEDSENLADLIPVHHDNSKDAILLTAKHMNVNPMKPPVNLRGLLSQRYLFKSLIVRYIQFGDHEETTAVMQILDSYGLYHLRLFCKSILEYAWEFENFAVCEFLWRRGTKLVDHLDRRIGVLLKTHLHVAVDHGRVQSARHILQLYRSRRIDIDARDREGATALHYSCRGSDPIHRSMSSGALFFRRDPEYLEGEGEVGGSDVSTEVGSIMSAPPRIGLVEEPYTRRLRHSPMSQDERISLVSLLVRFGADVNKRNFHRKNTPLHFACALPPEESNPIVELLIGRGADVNARNAIDQAPLHVAALRKSLGLVKILVRGGAHIAVYDDLRSSPLHYAVRMRSHEIVRYFLRMEVKSGQSGGPGISRSISSLSIRELLRTENLKRKTPLMVAVDNGDVEMVDLLVRNGVEPRGDLVAARVGRLLSSRAPPPLPQFPVVRMYESSEGDMKSVLTSDSIVSLASHNPAPDDRSG